MNPSWVDLLILLALAYGAFEGWRRGLLVEGTELGGFLIGILAATLGYRSLATFISSHSRVIPPLANLLAYALLFALVQLLVMILARRLIAVLPPPRRDGVPVSHLGGVGIGLAKNLILTTLMLMVVMGLPFLASEQKQAIADSRLAGALLAASGQLQQRINQFVGTNLGETLNFLTVSHDTENVELGFHTTDVRVNERAETLMLELLNEERVSQGLPPVVMDRRLQEVARAHSRDMFARGYFSHVNPDGQDPFHRIEAAGISYRAAGENLALAPTTDTAHQGLMDSPGHRANILEPEFGRVGIGAIDGGPYGIMFTQNFTD